MHSQIASLIGDLGNAVATFDDAMRNLQQIAKDTPRWLDDQTSQHRRLRQVIESAAADTDGANLYVPGCCAVLDDTDVLALARRARSAHRVTARLAVIAERADSWRDWREGVGMVQALIACHRRTLPITTINPDPTIL